MRFLLTGAIAISATLCFAQTDSSSFFVYKGIQEKEKGRLLESYKAYEKAYSYNKDAVILKELADIMYDLRRYPQAREKYLLLEQSGKPSVETYRRLMDLSFNLRQFPEAIKYAQLVKKGDNAAKTAFIIGKSYYETEDYGNAIKYLNIAVTEDDKDAQAPYTIARSYAAMLNYKQAIPYFEKAISLQPDNNRWIYEAAMMYYAQRDDKNALKYMLLAAEKGYKRDNEYMENLAISYLNVKNTTKGLEILKESLSRRPTDVNLLNLIAEASYDAKLYADAIGYWDQLLAMDKENAMALYMIGMSYQKKGEKQKGQDLCDRAIQMDPSLAKNKQKMGMPGL
ncbi:MAG TPA: tetratricopeptide repeat protein [Flavisolibacter sp.]|jgi:tetratricopeptide (TPR) repeat protein|nr:tetratricopeptide repeat protein [Flavisolibacter sp.]